MPKSQLGGGLEGTFANPRAESKNYVQSCMIPLKFYVSNWFKECLASVWQIAGMIVTFGTWNLENRLEHWNWQDVPKKKLALSGWRGGKAISCSIGGGRERRRNQGTFYPADADKTGHNQAISISDICKTVLLHVNRCFILSLLRFYMNSRRS